MKLKVPAMFLILALSCVIEAQENKWVPSNYKDLSFKEFVSATQPLLKVKFFYKDEWVKDLKMGTYPESFSLSDVLDNLLRGTSIYYYVDRLGNVVLTKNYEVRIPDVSYNRETSFITASASSYPVKGGQETGKAFVVVGNPAKTGKQGTPAVSGYVTDSETKEPLAGVTVSNQDHSAETFTNGSGFYSLILPQGFHTLKFSSLGMQEKTIDLQLIGDGEMNVEMNSQYIPLKETLIFARRRMVLQRFEAGVENINITSLKLSPTTLGESDIVNSILLVPGVKSVGEGSAGFNVRGGSADQNLILLYGAPLFNSSHFFGFFSAINPDIIKDVSLYKGGIPGRYGGRISSVLDISASEGNKKEFEGSAGISPVATHITIQGPFKEDTLSYILSLRNTYSNWILGLIQDPTLHRSRASFYDINGKVTYDLNKSDKIEAASYFSHDAFRLGSDSLYQYNNHILALKWQHVFSSTFFSAFSINDSYSEYNISSHEFKPESFILSHKINSTGLRADFTWFRGRSEFNFGLDVNSYKVLPGSYKPANDSSLVSPLIIDRERALEASLYIDDKFKLTDFLSVNAGIRISSYLSLGPSSVMVYQKGFSKSPSSVVDTLNFRPLEVSKLYAGPELRLSLNFRTSDNSS
jgi:hypothetical protein